LRAQADAGGCLERSRMLESRSGWIDGVLEDCEHLEYGAVIEVVSFATLVAMIALAGVSVVAVTFLYAL
jgi:hypothetical protein